MSLLKQLFSFLSPTEEKSKAYDYIYEDHRAPYVVDVKIECGHSSCNGEERRLEFPSTHHFKNFECSCGGKFRVAPVYLIWVGDRFSDGYHVIRSVSGEKHMAAHINSGWDMML